MGDRVRGFRGPLQTRLGGFPHYRFIQPLSFFEINVHGTVSGIALASLLVGLLPDSTDTRDHKLGKVSVGLLPVTWIPS
ncbi:hypothetical protein AGR1C_pAt40089 [Agrobacterium fabacearum TT111]|nr:hypothetical protein AGR1C_pAt40089 [Agrobacterium fabacearum TT111]